MTDLKTRVDSHSPRVNLLNTLIPVSKISDTIQRSLPAMMRLSLAIIFIWFGALKFFPGASPAEALAGRTIEILTFGTLHPNWSMPILAGWECLMGICLAIGYRVQLVSALLLVHLLGTLTPLVILPHETFIQFPVPTLAGQYILKNAVLITGALGLAVNTAACRAMRVAPASPLNS